MAGISNTLLLTSLTCALLLTLGSGCTTMETSRYTQAVLIRSEPPGATILVNSLEQGKTPGFAKIRRGRTARIELQTPAQTLQVPLEHKYRWRDSFFSNFVFLTYAPVGWLLDLLTGTSWNTLDPDVVKLESGSLAGNGVKKANLVYSIAPPLAESLVLSDAGGHGLERTLNSRTHDYTVRPYDETLPIFVGHDYDFDGAPSGDDRRDIYAALGSDVVYESSIEAAGNHLLLKARPYNVYNKTSGDPVELKFKAQDEIDDLFSNRNPWFHALPNTVSLDWIDDSLTWQDQVGTIHLAPVASRSFWLNAFDVISAVSFTSLPARRYGRSSRWQFNFIPVVHLSEREYQASNYVPLDGQYFERTWASAGYGGEVGFQISRHYIYINVVPQFYWDQIRWRSSDDQLTKTGSGLTFQEEIGYLFFFSKNWAVSLFFRSQNEDQGTWNAALSAASNEQFSVGSVTRSQSGISISYRLEPSYNQTHWLLN